MFRFFRPCPLVGWTDKTNGQMGEGLKYLLETEREFATLNY